MLQANKKLSAFAESGSIQKVFLVVRIIAIWQTPKKLGFNDVDKSL